ncbi:hypothetical protein GCM10017691_20170 [Pseudonocardia petroleophila]|uniref:hypothetical protein n=1 Tax=Pseudonocardia petroleophila TaxID=37331 RepID=UPI0031DDA7D7
MRQGRDIATLGTRTAAFAAVTTVLVAVTAGVVAGSHPLHTATFGVAAIALGLMRLAQPGRHRGYFAAASGMLVSEPVVHAVMAVLPYGTEHSGDPAILPLQMVLAVLVIAAVAGAETLYLQAGALWRALRLPRRPLPVPGRLTPPLIDVLAAAVSGPGAGQFRRRGPPSRLTVA